MGPTTAAPPIATEQRHHRNQSQQQSSSRSRHPPSYNDEYTPTPLPVLNQMRAAGILPSLESLEAEDSPCPSVPAAPSAPNVIPKRPAEPIPSRTEPPVPTKAPRVDPISPLDYLKHIIEGKNVPAPPSFVNSLPLPPQFPPSPPPKSSEKPSDPESDSNSPVKSRLLPPVELDYAPAFAGPVNSSDTKEQPTETKKGPPTTPSPSGSPSKRPRIAPAFGSGGSSGADFRLNFQPSFGLDDGSRTAVERTTGVGTRKDNAIEDKRVTPKPAALRTCDETAEDKKEVPKPAPVRTVDVEDRGEAFKPAAIKISGGAAEDRRESPNTTAVEKPPKTVSKPLQASVKIPQRVIDKEVKPKLLPVEEGKKEEDVKHKPKNKVSHSEKAAVKHKELDISLKTARQSVPDTGAAKRIKREVQKDKDLNVVDLRSPEKTTPKLVETPPKTRQVASKMALTGDNIFARLSSLTKLASSEGTEEENEYVPTFVNKKQASVAEYTPSTSVAFEPTSKEEEYVPMFLNSKAAESAAAEYQPANFVDLTKTPPKDLNTIVLPSSDDDFEEDGGHRNLFSKVTRSRTFIRERTLLRAEKSHTDSQDSEEQAKRKKKKKKEKRAEFEAVVLAEKKKKKKKKSKEKDKEKEVLRSLFGEEDDDDEECEPEEAPSSSRPSKPRSFSPDVALPSGSRTQPRSQEEPELTSYFDPVRQKWYRDDGTEDTARSTASGSASSASKASGLAASCVRGAARPRNPFQLSARDVMHKRMQWFEQLKLEAAAKAAGGKDRNASSSVKSGSSGVQNHVNNIGGSCSKTPVKAAPKVNDVRPARSTGAAKPTMPRSIDSKIPLEVRRRYLEVFVEECLKIYEVDTDAYDRALEEEEAACKRSSNRTVYLNVVVNARKRLIREHQNAQNPEAAIVRQTVSHQAVLGGRLAAEGNFGLSLGIGRSIDHQVAGALAGDGFYDGLVRYCLTEEQHMDNGFPIPVGNGEVDLPGAEEKLKKMLTKNEDERVCQRCGATFKVDEDGEQEKEVECLYHWGKAWKRKVPGQGFEQRYTCCGSDTSVKWCEMGHSHVHESNRYTDLTHYKRTPNQTSSKGRRSLCKGVYALDCEMLYTTIGSELARITVVDRNCQTVYERIVQPRGRIIDYNTRFSGLKEEDFEGADVSNLSQVQKDLRRLFNSETILIGHSLESDLLALKLCHEKVVDTSVVFPHRLGPPKKRALKTLAAEILQMIIQADVGGHDSKEDAAACMQLMLYQVRQDLRKSFRASATTS